MSLFQRPSRFAVKVNEPVAPTTYGPDHIETYLKEPPIPSSVITDTGGYLKFWSGAAVKCPGLARMGTDFCLTPGMCPPQKLQYPFLPTQPQHHQLMQSVPFQLAVARSTLCNTIWLQIPSRQRWHLAPGMTSHSSPGYRSLQPLLKVGQPVKHLKGSPPAAAVILSNF